MESARLPASPLVKLPVPWETRAVKTATDKFTYRGPKNREIGQTNKYPYGRMIVGVI